MKNYNWYILYGNRSDGVRDIIMVFNGRQFEFDYVQCEAKEKQDYNLGHDYNFEIVGVDNIEEII